MVKYFLTTNLIIIWCMVLSFIWALFCYLRASRYSGSGDILAAQRVPDKRQLFLPALVIGPVVIFCCYHVFAINLLFPIHIFASFGNLVLKSAVPAVVLIIASGLVSSLSHSIRQEYQVWSVKSFCIVTRAYGGSKRRALARLVLLKSMIKAWSQCLPWLFGELVVVECVFNAPGLGQDAWHMARIRDPLGLFAAILLLIIIYGAITVFLRVFSAYLGKRLTGYA